MIGWVSHCITLTLLPPSFPFKDPSHYTGPSQITQDNYFILHSTDYNLISIYYLISPFLCNLTYSQVPGIRTWTSFARTLFCLAHQVKEFQLYSVNSIEMSTVLEQVNNQLAPAFWKQNCQGYEGWISEDEKQGVWWEGYYNSPNIRDKRSEPRQWSREGKKEGGGGGSPTKTVAKNCKYCITEKHGVKDASEVSKEVNVLHFNSKAWAWNSAPILAGGPSHMFPQSNPHFMPQLGWMGFQVISLHLCILPLLDTCSWPNCSFCPILFLPICLGDWRVCLLLPAQLPELLRIFFPQLTFPGLIHISGYLLSLFSTLLAWISPVGCPENLTMAAASQYQTDEGPSHSWGGKWGGGVNFSLKLKLMDKHLIKPRVLNHRVKGSSTQAREYS